MGFRDILGNRRSYYAIGWGFGLFFLFLREESCLGFFCLVNCANISADSSPTAVAQLRLNVTPCLAYAMDQIWSHLVIYTGNFTRVN